MKKVLSIVAVMVSLLSVGQLRAGVIISADNLPIASNAVKTIGSYDYQGFTLSGSGITELGPNYLGQNVGGNTFFSQNSGGNSIVTKDGGGAFDVTSIDISRLYPPIYGGPATPVHFVGALAGGGTVTQDITLAAGTYGLYTVTLTGFTDVTSFSFAQTYYFNQYTNIVINGGNTAPVPEPSSLALLSVGGIAFAVYRRRRALAA